MAQQWYRLFLRQGAWQDHGPAKEQQDGEQRGDDRTERRDDLKQLHHVACLLKPIA
jgi:hypothetical protein